MRKFGLCILALLLPAVVQAQKFSYTQYRTGQGLPSDHVHAVVRDSTGFVWVATARGMVRYDGQAFTRYPDSRAGHSVTALHRSSNGEIVFADSTGVFAVTSETDTATVRRLVDARSQPTDSTVVNPDGLYRDARGHLWISQSNGSVARFRGNRLRTFALGDDHAGNESVPASSFLFAEDEQNRLWMLARTGQLYRYARPKARFERVPLSVSLNDARDLRIRNDTLWTAGNRLVQARVTENGDVADVRSYATNGRQLTHMAFAREGLLLSTQQDGLFRASLDAGALTMHPVFGANDPHRTEPLPFQTIHHVNVDRDGSLWVSSRQGLGLLESHFFSVVPDLSNYNILSVRPDGKRAFLSFGDVYEIRPGPRRNFFARTAVNAQQSFITGLAVTEDTLWLGTTEGTLLKHDDGRTVLAGDFSDRAGPIFYMFGDRRGNVWFCQAPTDTPLKGVSRIDPNGEMTFYDADDGVDNRVLSLREGPGGTLYAAGIGPDSYLYRYEPERDRFTNLSLPLSFDPSPGFEAHDVVADERGVVWLATTDGLLRHDREHVRRVDLGPHTKTEIRSVEAMSDGSIWMATDADGLLHYRDGTWVQFGKSTGLLSEITVYRTLRKDGREGLWVGTAEGIMYSRGRLPVPESTPKPVLLSAQINGRHPGTTDSLSLRTHDALSLRFAALTFPNDAVQYQYRLTGTTDSSWSAASTEPSLHLRQPPSSTQSLEIRVRGGSGHYWSDPLRVPMYVRPVWYRTWWAYVLFVLGGIGALGSMVYLYAERKRAKQALQESQARLHGLAHSVPGVIFQFYARPDGEYGAHFVSQQSESVLGLDPEEDTFIERFLECVPPEHREDVFASVEDAVENKEQWSFEMPFVKPSGETIWIQGVSTLEDREDELIFSSVILDVTTRKHLESQLHQAHRLETVGTLAGGIAHDFNNILHTASAYLELATDEVPETNLAREFLKRTKEDLQQAEALADKLLTFSQPDSTTVRKEVTLSTLIRNTIDLAASSLSEAITLDVDLCDACTVNGDPDQLRQIVLNLVTNAGHAMAADDNPPADTGHVLGVSLETIEIDADMADRYLHLDPGVYAHLSVADTGLGMDEATMERIFDPFFTNEDSPSTDALSDTTPSKRGAGLGLSVAYSAVEAHGGDITVDSEPGVGTTFDIYLPAVPSPRKDPSPPEEPADTEEPHPV